MKKYTILILMGLVCAAARPQSSIDRILQSIERNNKELQADTQLTASQKLEARIGNSLPDPTVTYEFVKGNSAEAGKEGELTVAQSFDFPTVYVNKNKIARLQSVVFDRRQAQFRQNLLLQAKELCLDVVALNRQQSLLDRRKANAEALLASYSHRMETGSATILEVNKIKLELLNVRTEARRNEASRQARLQELAALNGDIPVELADTVYAAVPEVPAFAALREEALASDPELQIWQGERAVAERSVALSRSEWLPKFELGYKHTRGSGEKFNGIVAGISIPLYENRHKVKQAKVRTLYADLKAESATLQVEAALRSLYEELLAVKASIDEYDRTIDLPENFRLLDKALAGGQLSTIDYFVELDGLNRSMQNYIELENQYRKLLAQLYKFRL